MLDYLTTVSLRSHFFKTILIFLSLFQFADFVCKLRPLRAQRSFACYLLLDFAAYILRSRKTSAPFSGGSVADATVSQEAPAVITPHAIFLPEFPDGWLVKSSGDECITTVLPMIPSTVNLSVSTAEYAYPFTPNSGGRSPA